MTVWRMRIACWTPKTLSKYVIIIYFPLKEWLHKRASMFVISTFPALLNFSDVRAMDPRHKL